MTEVVLRHVEQEDYQPIISVVDEWWGGRPMAAMLPKLFFVHFSSTREPLGNERSWRAPGLDLCLLNILNADQA